jgi:uncharacterized membrane-anchored protein
MKPKLILSLFLAVAAAQLTVPISQIWQYERTLATGRVYKFRTAPVDPYDAFRGRYVALNYDKTTAPVRVGDHLENHQHACARIEEGTDGFARFMELSESPPKDADYVRVDCSWGGPDGMRNFTVPFNRFYMEESAAPKAEAAYREFGNRRGKITDETYVLVRVKAGRGVIEDLFVKDKPIRRYLEEHG